VLGDRYVYRLVAPQSFPAWSTLLAALGLLVLGGTPRLWLAVLTAVAVLLAGLVTGRLLGRSPEPRLFLTLTPLLIVTLGMVPVAYEQVGKSHLDIRPYDTARSGLYRWARNGTPAGSIFVVPFGWKDFRLNARRAVVADWAAPPLYPADFLQWYDRLRALTGLQHPHSLQDAESGYAQLDCKRAGLLHRRYAARYFVLKQEHPLPCGTVVYRDSAYQVVEYAP
jgi:hypothetical protein